MGYNLHFQIGSNNFLLLANLFYEVLTFFCFVFYPILSDNEKTRKPSIRSQLTDSNLQLMHRKYIIEKCFMLRVVGSHNNILLLRH